MSELDNPVWSALTTRQEALGHVGRTAARFDPAVSPFAAFSGPPTPDHWAELADLIGPSGLAALVHRPDGATGLTPPTGWIGNWKARAHQMVGRDFAFGSARTARVGDDRIQPLGPGDVAAMLALVELARPGPFLARTVEFGGYVGIRRGGHLVAMAGERLQPPGYVEISAVATHPDHRRQGLAERLVASSILERGEVPVLHVSEDNSGAVALYEAMGFVTRTRIAFELFKAPVAG